MNLACIVWIWIGCYLGPVFTYVCPGHSTIHSKRSISCENEGPIHLISEQEQDKEQQPAGDGPITTATKDTVVLLEFYQLLLLLRVQWVL